MDFKFILPRRISFGKSLINEIGQEAKRLGAKRVLIVTSQGMSKRECLKQVADSLRDCNLSFSTFQNVEPEPPIENLGDCIAFAKETGSDLLIGLGGGSVMDVAKKAAADLLLPMIMAPTTAGSGSEVTPYSVLAVHNQKEIFVGENLVPDVAIVDPSLTETMPPRLTVTTGMDALGHAIESYQSRIGNPITRALASEAYNLIKDNLRKAVDNDLEARYNMSLASLMAGLAISYAGTCLGHALSYPLADEGVPHGEAVAVTLPYALEFNGFDPEVIAEVRSLLRDLAISVTFKSDIHQMARRVMQLTRNLSHNPREVSLEDVVNIYRKMQQETSLPQTRRDNGGLDYENYSHLHKHL